METVSVICSASAAGRKQPVPAETEELLRQKGVCLKAVACNSKEEAEHAVYRGGGIFLVAERCFFQNPYQAAELAALRDMRKVRIVALVDRCHYGTAYMATLYAAGILDAVFGDEADARRMAERILRGRNRKECREYYGIRSMDEAVSVLKVMEPDTARRYVRYVGSGTGREEMLKRYREVEGRLSYVENCCLVGQIPERVAEAIGGDAGFDRYRPFRPHGDGKGRWQTVFGQRERRLV